MLLFGLAAVALGFLAVRARIARRRHVRRTRRRPRRLHRLRVTLFEPRPEEYVPASDRLAVLSALRAIAAGSVLSIAHFDPRVRGHLLVLTVGYLAIVVGVEIARHSARPGSSRAVSSAVFVDGAYLAFAVAATGGIRSLLTPLVFVELAAVDAPRVTVGGDRARRLVRAVRRYRRRDQHRRPPHPGGGGRPRGPRDRGRRVPRLRSRRRRPERRTRPRRRAGARASRRPGRARRVDRTGAGRRRAAEHAQRPRL